MQQTKRRSKKGVILLALALALFVLAIVPAVAMAAPTSLSIQHGAAMIGTTTMDLTYNSGPGEASATQVRFRDWNSSNMAAGPWSSYTAYTAGLVATFPDYTLTNATIPSDGDIVYVQVEFANQFSIGLGAITDSVLFDASNPESALDWGQLTTADTGLPGMTGGLGQQGVYYLVRTALPPVTLTAQFGITNVVPMGSTNYQVNGGALIQKNWDGGFAPLPVSIVGTIDWNSHAQDGIYTVNHTAASLGGAKVGATMTDAIGIDTIPPTIAINDLPTGWVGTGGTFSGAISDPGGSGVWNYPQIFVTYDNSHAPVAVTATYTWDFWGWDFTGTASILPGIPGGYHPTGVTVSAEDVAGNIGTADSAIKIDVTPPVTVYTSDPTGYTADPFNPPFFPAWTNTGVTLHFLAADYQSGVAYTEYIINPAGAPSFGATGTQGTSALVNVTAKTGPVTVYFRSVDKATPPNKEIWRSVWVYFDGVAPVITAGVPENWINGTKVGDSIVGSVAIPFSASDPNSGIAAPGAQFRAPTFNWLGLTPQYLDWTTGIVANFPINRVTHVNDGIFPFQYRATDRAGNSTDTTATPPAPQSKNLQIDTQAPVTTGVAGWVNGLQPYTLSATDQTPGAGVYATIYRVDMATAWSESVATTVTPSMAFVTTLPAWVSPVQGSWHQIDFGSVDNARPVGWKAADGWTYGNMEFGSVSFFGTDNFNATGFKSIKVQLDITAPVVTAVDPKNGAWQKGPAVINFSGTDVGSGFAYTEWTTNGTDWIKGNSAEIGGDSPADGTVVTYHGVDNVGLMSKDQTITVKVASTSPTVTGGNVSVKMGHKATFRFNVTAVTPNAQVIIQIRSKNGHTLSTHHYANVTTNADGSRSFRVNLPKGKYNIRIGATDQAGNVQTQRGGGTLTVK